MTIGAIIRTISLILAPAVMITSCAILLNGIVTRYESVSVRMRAMHRERLELLQGLGNTTNRVVPTGEFNTRRIHEIEVQLLHLLQRHKLIRNAVLAENGCVAKTLGKRNGRETSLLFSLGSHSKRVGNERDLSHDIPFFDASHLPCPDHVHELVSLQRVPCRVKRKEA